jgi:hypothetical protein
VEKTSRKQKESFLFHVATMRSTSTFRIVIALVASDMMVLFKNQLALENNPFPLLFSKIHAVSLSLGTFLGFECGESEIEFEIASVKRITERLEREIQSSIW